MGISDNGTKAPRRTRTVLPSARDDQRSHARPASRHIGRSQKIVARRNREKKAFRLVKNKRGKTGR